MSNQTSFKPERNCKGLDRFRKQKILISCRILKQNFLKSRAMIL